MEILSETMSLLDPGDAIFFCLLALTVLIMLYVLAALHQKIRLLENETQLLRRDQRVINEEIKLLVSRPIDDPGAVL